MSFHSCREWSLVELKNREPVHLAGPLCVTPSSRGLPPAPPLLLGVLGIPFPAFVRRSLQESRDRGRSSPQVLQFGPTTLPLLTREVCLFFLGSLLFLHLGSFLVLAPRRRHPLPPPPADSSRPPYPSACPYSSSSCPFKCLPPHPAPPAAQGLGGRRRRRHPAPATCAAAARGPAQLQVRLSTPARYESPGVGPLLRSPNPGIPAAGDSGSDSPPAGAALPLSPALSNSPISPLSSATGIRRLLTRLRQPLPSTLPILDPGSPPPPRLPRQKNLPRSGFRRLPSGSRAFPRHPNLPVGGGITATPLLCLLRSK